MNQSETLLEIKDLCVEFKTMAGTVHAVDHLSYTLHRGEKLGIVGESGSGKSTVAKIIMGLIPADEGAVWVNGDPVKYPYARKQLQQQLRRQQLRKQRLRQQLKSYLLTRLNFQLRK